MVVYLADQDTDDMPELYRVPFATPGVSTKLNSPLVSNGEVSSFVVFVTPVGTAVVYTADQDTDTVVELYRVPFATPGVSTKLNGPLVPGGDVKGVQVIVP